MPAPKNFHTKTLNKDSFCFAFFGEWTDKNKSLKDIEGDPNIDVVQVDPLLAIKFPPNRLIEILRGKSSLPLLGFASVDDDGFPLANCLNFELTGKNFSHQEPRELMRNKLKLYNHLSKNNLPTVGFFAVDSLSDITEIERGLEEKIKTESFVIKPAIGEDSDGVYRSKPQESLAETLASYEANLERINLYKRNYLGLGSAHIFMEYIEFNGEPVEVIVDGYFCNRKCVVFSIGEKICVRKYEPFFDTLIVSPPNDKKILANSDQLREVTEKILLSLGVNHGPFHFEFRINSSGVIPIDCSLRVGGGYVNQMVEELTGVDLNFLAIREFFPDSINNIALTKLIDNRACAIGVGYSDHVTEDNFLSLLNYLNTDKEIISYHVVPAFSNDKYCRKELKLSLAVKGTSSLKAKEKFFDCLTKFSLSPL
jgi:ATP-grasp domain